MPIHQQTVSSSPKLDSLAITRRLVGIPILYPLSPSQGPTTTTMGVPTIIDCDPGVDDVLGLLLALSSPSIELIALYSQFGNTDASAATNNILKMYGVIDRHCRQFPQDKARFPAIFADNATRPLVIKGAEHPIEGAFHTAAYFHGRDGELGMEGFVGGARRAKRFAASSLWGLLQSKSGLGV